MEKKDILISELGKDGYYLYIYDVLNTYWPVMYRKYKDLIDLYRIDRDDVIQDCIVKLLRKRKDGLTYYEKACKENWTAGTIKRFTYLTMSGVIIDFGRCTSLAPNLPGKENYYHVSDKPHVPKQLWSYDELHIERDELIGECFKRDDQHIVGNVIKLIVEGATLSEACKEIGVTRYKFRRLLVKSKINIEDYV